MNKFLLVTISCFFILTANCQTIDFTFESSNGLFCNPVTIQFKQACTGNPKSFIWSFGNNKYSEKPDDSSTYLIAGSYTVKLSAIFANTTLEISKTITINPSVTASIGYDRNYICQPGTINFTGSGSGNIANYEWDFGDGTAVVNTSSTAISHSFANFGEKNVLLKTSSNSGCSDTISTIITIKKLAITVDVSRIRGCIPAVVNFTANVILPLNSSVTGYNWDFGDGSPPYIATVNTATHIYSAVGNYFPSFIVTSSEGCTSTYKFTNRLYFGTPPTNHVAYAQTNPICGSDSAVFITKATNANRYYWDFGDGTNASSNDTIIRHKYKTIGNKTIRVNAYYNECGAPSLAFPFSVIGIIAKYSSSNTCSNKNTYSFSDSTSGVPTSRLWNFGDGIQQPNVVNPVHSFPLSGQFTTTLSMEDTNTGCSDSISSLVYTAIPNLYSTDSSVCRNTRVNFSILNNYTDTSARYTWNVAGSETDSVSQPIFTADANLLGNFNNFVVVGLGPRRCPDTVMENRPFLVRGPNLNFTAPTDICSSTPLIVTNNSQPFAATDTILRWVWNFAPSGINDSGFQPLPFQYTSSGTYDVRLSAVDKNGCKDTLTKSLIVKPSPFLHISPQRDSLCLGQSVTMIAFHNNDLLWSPAGSLSCATCDTTIAKPLVSTMYYGTATNSFNCSVQDSSYIEVNKAFTTTIIPADIYICQNESATVDVNPKGKKIIWSPTAGLSNPAIYNAVITPTQNTSYTVTLSDSTGCSTSSAIVNIHVKSLPFVYAGPDKFFSKGESYSLTPTYSDNINSYFWTPSVLLSCSDCPSPGGVANYNENYIIKVISDSGCVSSDSVRIWIDCKSATVFMPRAFTPDNNNLNDFYYPITNGIKSVLKFTIYNRQGQVMHEARNFPPNDKMQGWDGKFKGANQSMGTYLYAMEITCETGERFSKKGSFLLIR